MLNLITLPSETGEAIKRLFIKADASHAREASLCLLSDDALRARMEGLFDRLQMNEIRDLLGSKMSTGMKQKVSIARALVHDPPVLIFDEPTTGLDVLVARALLETVALLRDQGKCIVFSTHIMREAEKLCDRVAIVHRGKILAEGTLKELRDHYEEAELEELFFRLISDHDDKHVPRAPMSAQ